MILERSVVFKKTKRKKNATNTNNDTPRAQKANWTHIRYSEDGQGVFQRLVSFNTIYVLYQKSWGMVKSNRPEVFCEKGVSKNFAKFTGKHLRQSLFLIKLQAWGLQLYWKETLTQVFSCEFCELFNDTFFHRTPPVAASEWCNGLETSEWKS